MLKTILAISGKPGLYTLISKGRGMLIVESVDTVKKRMPVGARDKVTSLNDIAIYTEEDDEPLMKVFENIKAKENGAITSLDPKRATKQELADYMAEILPGYDRERVYITDIKKLLTWYNTLVMNGFTDFEVEEAVEAEVPSEEVAG